MNIWIVKKGEDSFTQNFINNSTEVSNDIDQLKHKTVFQKTINKFHLLSIFTNHEHTPKRYIQENEKGILGFSGLVIDKSSKLLDLRNAANLKIDNINSYSGQYSIFEISNDEFKCKVDNFGFHKVFYFHHKNDIYTSNSIELLKATGLLKPDIEQVLLDLMTSRFGIHPGYKTLFEGVFTLPEYGELSIIKDDLKVGAYKTIEDLISPKETFEEQLAITINEFKETTKYLRKYHHTVVPLSGGFDGRLILSFFNDTEGLPLETMTYNRAGGGLDFYIASKLSKKFKVPHKKIKIPTELAGFKIEVPEFQNSKNDPFTDVFNKSLAGFYEEKDCFKVSLGGNGADTDWEFGEKFLKKLDSSNFRSFIKDYCKLITKHTLIKEELSQKLALKLEEYFIEKYISFEKKNNFVQLLGSAFFHLERFRGRQGFVYSQYSNKKHDVYAPFAAESFNKLVYLAEKKQLQRG